MTIIGMVFGTQAVLLVIAYFIQSLFAKMSELLDTRRSILLSLLVYSAIAVWGFFLDSTIEYWFLAWMVAIVQGGSQALSRSLYSSMCPSSKSGEFFGFFSIMEKFASIIGPLLFAFAALTFGSSRPAILSLIALFIIGGYLLTRVNIEEGRRVAQEEDAALMKSAS
jgi:UMF1 family MFS transporter